VGLIFSVDEPRYGNDQHLRQVFAISRALYGLHIPFAAVSAEDLAAGQFARPKVLVAAPLEHLSDAQLARLETFARDGGRLLIDATCGVRDLLDLPRQGPFAGTHVVPRCPRCQRMPA
jgi:hypothetical protein